MGGGVPMNREASRVARALGLHHTLPTAVADLVDNSVDAQARHILIRFLQAGRRVTGLRVIDDGRGMDGQTIDAAMRYGATRGYGTDEQGHFGVGMKAASISQADTLTVYSRAPGCVTHGRRLTVSDRDDVPRLEAIDDDDAQAAMDVAHPRFPFDTGTIVEWRGIRTFPTSADPDDQAAWLEGAIGDLRDWLGLVFHRLITRGISITVDVFDDVERRAGASRSVRAIDPFGYRRSGDPDYPRELSVRLADPTTMAAHIWPARTAVPEYKLGGMPGRDSQGFFVYRNDRLLHAGGWLGVVRPRPEWGLARVAVELDSATGDHVVINPEKSGVTIDAALSAAWRDVLSSGYLDDAEAAARAARRVQRRPVTVVEPGAGLPDEVLDEFADCFTFVDSADPVEIGWRVLAGDRFFEVDLENRSLWINARFRRRLGGSRKGGSDVPLLRTLLFLLSQDMFDATRHSSKQAEQLDSWQRVLIAAMSAEEVVS
ncbi:ATP-binding protein [Gordonia rhizosphera]|nr:ATP-binding protein [Gordonia rhizosphera]